MRLKYDVIFSDITDGKLEISKLVPKLQSWVVKIPPSHSSNVQRFLDNLANGVQTETHSDPLLLQVQNFLTINGMITSLEIPSAENPFRRQIEYFESWCESSDIQQVQERLRQSVVLVIGAGGVGSVIANTLISSGVGTVLVADFDTIAISNLARQTFFTKSDIGKKKVFVLSEFINKRGLGTCVPLDMKIDSSSIQKIFNRFPDISIVTGWHLPSAEYEQERRDLVKVTLRNDKSFFFVGEHDVGPYVYDEAGLHAHINASSRMKLHPIWEKSRARRRNQNFHPSFAPEIQRSTGLAAEEIVRAITGIAEVRSKNSRYSLNPISGEIVRLNLNGTNYERN